MAVAEIARMLPFDLGWPGRVLDWAARPTGLAAAVVAPMVGTYTGVLAGVGAYVVVMVVAGPLMPTVNEVGDFPADTLWYFRRASLLTGATLWVGGRPMSGAGVGMSFLDGLIRFDLSRGINPGKKIRLDMYVDAKF